MNKRDFMKGILALGIAPAIVKAENLMRIATPKIILYGDGIHDDTQALQTWIDGGRVLRPDGSTIGRHITGGDYRISNTIFLDKGVGKKLTNSYIHGHLGEDKPLLHTTEWRGPLVEFNIFDFTTSGAS